MRQTSKLPKCQLFYKSTLADNQLIKSNSLAASGYCLFSVLLYLVFYKTTLSPVKTLFHKAVFNEVIHTLLS